MASKMAAIAMKMYRKILNPKILYRMSIYTLFYDKYAFLILIRSILNKILTPEPIIISNDCFQDGRHNTEKARIL